MGFTEHTLLAAIYAAPDDDAPRAVYADWLSERGDPRGEFIALQLARRGTVAARRREAKLLRDHGAAWAGGIGRFLFEGLRVFERGFLCGGVLRRELLTDIDAQPAQPAQPAEPEWALFDTLVIHRVEDALVPFPHRLKRIRIFARPEQLVRLVALPPPATVAVLEARERGSEDGYTLRRDDDGRFTRFHAVSSNPLDLRLVIPLLPQLTELIVERGRIGWTAREIAHIESGISGLQELRRIEVPWDRSVGPRTPDLPRIELVFPNTKTAPEAILDALTAPPLSFTFDAMAVNLEHQALVGDPRVVAKKQLAKKRVERVSFYRKAMAHSVAVAFERDRFEISLPRVADFDAWLTSFVDTHDVDRFYAPFLTRGLDELHPGHGPSAVLPLGDPLYWIWGFGPREARFFAFDDIVALAPAFPGFRIWKTKRHLVIRFGDDVEAPEWTPQHAAFEFALIDAFWRHFERQHGFRPRDVIVQTLSELGFTPVPHVQARDAAMGRVTCAGFGVEPLVIRGTAALHVRVSLDASAPTLSPAITTAEALRALMADLLPRR